MSNSLVLRGGECHGLEFPEEGKSGFRFWVGVLPYFYSINFTFITLLIFRTSIVLDRAAISAHKKARETKKRILLDERKLIVIIQFSILIFSKFLVGT